jgi:hypothetical protein
MNEHIVGTATFYLDCENVTAWYLEFTASTANDVNGT